MWPINNERIGADLAKWSMKEEGNFSTKDIAEVQVAILDTHLKTSVENKVPRQIATGRLSPWLLDADLANFGRVEFFQSMLKVYSEITGRQITSPMQLKNEKGRNFLVSSYQLVEKHEWKSNAGKSIFECQKKKNLKKLLNVIRAASGGTGEQLFSAWNEPA